MLCNDLVKIGFLVSGPVVFLFCLIWLSLLMCYLWSGDFEKRRYKGEIRNIIEDAVGEIYSAP